MEEMALTFHTGFEKEKENTASQLKARRKKVLCVFDGKVKALVLASEWKELNFLRIGSKQLRYGLLITTDERINIETPMLNINLPRTDVILLYLLA